jgi:hypothetical protein
MRSTRTVREEEREKGVRWCKPSVGTGAVEFDPEAAISFAGDALLTGSDGRRRGARCSDGGGASRRSQRDPRDRLGL